MLPDVVELKPTKAVPLNTMLPGAHPKALRLLQRMLCWNPAERISVDAALADLYLNQYHNPADEPVCTRRLDCTFDECQVTGRPSLIVMTCSTVFLHQLPVLVDWYR